MQTHDASTVQSPPIISKYSHLFRLLHWVLTVAFVVLLLTGLSLHAIARPERSFFSGVLPDYLWSGRVHLWHFATALVFCPSLLATILACRRRVWSRPIHAMTLGGGLVMIATGLLMFSAATSGEIAKVVIWLHSSVGLLLLPFALLWHLFSGFTRRIGLLVPAFHPFARPRLGQLFSFLIMAPVAVWLMAACWPVSNPWRTLVAVPVSPEEVTNSSMADLPWDKARPVTANLANGSGLDAGHTEVTLRAMHNGDELFVLAEWDDPTEDRRYTPWQKTSDGWEHLATDAKDECVYYEDKFALAFPTKPDWRFEQAGCALYCHAGGGNPYGCKNSDRIIDVWHWKATRTDPAGQADDKYWSHPKSETALSGRYGDPKDGGGYRKNEAADDQPHPAFLPVEPSAVCLGAIPEKHAVEYTEEKAAKIQHGTTIPGMITSPFLGDRGDLNCQSVHQNGRWALYFRRKLDTGSEYDVRFEPGGSYAFACAAFDHVSKRHAYSFSVFRLLITPAAPAL